MSVGPRQHEDVGQVVALRALGVVGDPGKVAGVHGIAAALSVPIIHEHSGLGAIQKAPGAAPVTGCSHIGLDLRELVAVRATESLPHGVGELEFIHGTAGEVVRTVDVAIGNDFVGNPHRLTHLGGLCYATYKGL